MQSDQQTTIVWKNISISVKEKVILDSCSGYCKPGEMVTIMGQSGAGKTTLLSTLCGQKSRNMTTSGELTANGNQYSLKDFFSFGSYVRQNDILHESLTVRQTLYFISKLKLDSEQAAQRRTDQLIKVFELDKCENAKTGGTYFKGISGGEKKRLCIAIEMVNEPSVLILDEPTSGLDSDKAIKVLRVLKKLSQKGKTILFTIHQPSYLIYNSLDRLILLKKGMTIYEGRASNVMNYMLDLGINVNKKYTVCDAFMFETSEYKAKTESYQTPFNAENFNKRILPRLNNQLSEIYKSPKSEFQVFQQNQMKNRCERFLTLIRRQKTLFFTNPMKFWRVIGTIVIQFLIVGTVFKGVVDENRPSSSQFYPQIALDFYFFQSEMVCFINVAAIIISRLFTTALILPVQRQIFIKQAMAKIYEPWAYYLAKIIIELPSLCLGALVYSAGSYWIMGFTTDIQLFAYFCLEMVILSISGNSLGMFCGIFFSTSQQVAVMVPMMQVPLMLFSGVFNNLNQIPKWISWLQYLTPFKYGVHTLVLNEYGDQKYNAQTYDYKEFLGIDMTFGQNNLVLLGISLFFYIVAFGFLKRASSKIII